MASDRHLCLLCFLTGSCTERSVNPQSEVSETIKLQFNEKENELTLKNSCYRLL